MRDGCKDEWMAGNLSNTRYSILLLNQNPHTLKTNSTICKTMQVHQIHFIQHVTGGGAGGGQHKQIL
jgi:hypothetical protein